MKYFFHFTYQKHDNDERLWYTCFLTVKSQKEAEEKAERCMSEFKNPKLVALRLEN